MDDLGAIEHIHRNIVRQRRDDISLPGFAPQQTDNA